MPRFSRKSLDNLNTCDARLILVFKEVVKHFDCTVMQGHRNEEDQNEAFRLGHSQLKWPNGNHNLWPSKAVDVAPYPIDWQDRERFTYFAGVVKGIAIMLGIPLRWGGDWDQDTMVKDNKFDDLPHFEIHD